MTTKDKVLGMMKRASAAKAFYGKVMQKRAAHVKLAAARRLYGKVMQKRAAIADANHLEACYMEGFRKTAEAYGVDSEELMKCAALFNIGNIFRGAKNIWNGLKSVGSAVGNAVMNPGQALGNAYNGLKSIGSAVGNAVMNPGQALGNAYNGLKGMASNPGSFFSNIGNRLGRFSGMAPGGGVAAGAKGLASSSAPGLVGA